MLVFNIRKTARKTAAFLIAFMIMTVFISSSFAQDANQQTYQGVNSCNDVPSCLNAIVQNTYGTLQSVNNVPTYLHQITEFALSFMAHDKSSFTSSIQGNFATLGTLITQDLAMQNSQALQQQLTIDSFGSKSDGTPLITSADLTGNNPAVLSKIPNFNDLAYSTLLGFPPLPKHKSIPYNYIKFASGITMNHVLPAISGWKGQPEDQARYANYFNTLIAVETFNAYTLSGLYAEFQNGNGLSTQQNALITQASGSDWIAQIATEDLGVILRQLLMFQSQTYVLLTQLVQTQKQLLTSQAMTNSLLVLVNANNETSLVSRAKGTT